MWYWMWYWYSSVTGRNIIVFVVEINSSTKIDNKQKYILILGKGTRQGSIQLILQSIIKSSA